MMRVIRYTAFSLFLCLLFSTDLSASVSDNYYEDLVFESIVPDLNFSFSIVEAIAQDDYGFIWIGAKDGLYRYDGVYFQRYSFHRDDPGSISNDVISTIFNDSRGNLWVGTENGLNRYQVEKDNFIRYIAGSNLSQNFRGSNIRKILEDDCGNIWIATRMGGIVRYHHDSGEFTDLNDILTGGKELLSGNIRNIFIDSKGYFWIATLDRGVLYFKMEEPKLKSLSVIAEVLGEDIRALGEDITGRIWIGSNGNGLASYDKKSGEIEYYSVSGRGKNHLSCDFIWDIYRDKSGLLWVSTDGGGLCQLKKIGSGFTTFRTSITDPNSINSDVVRVFFEDIAGNYWIGHYNAPVNFVNMHRKNFKVKRGMLGDEEITSQDRITAIHEDSEGNKWFATDGAGLICQDRASGKYIHFSSGPAGSATLVDNKPMCIEEDREGNIWIGHFGGGISCYVKEAGKFKRYLPGTGSNQLHGQQIWDLMVEGDTLWIASKQGLEYLDMLRGQFNQVTFESSGQEFDHQGLLNLFRDSKNRLLIGSYDGLFVYEPENDQLSVHNFSFSDSTSLSDGWITCLQEDVKNRVWIGTNCGLNLWDEQDQFRCFTMEDGLGGNVIAAIEEDLQGNLWISTNRGISKFNFDSLSWTNYTIEDGLSGEWFRLNSSYRTREGKLFFGSNSGVSYFIPEQILSSDFIPPIALTGLAIYNEPVNIGAKDSPLESSILIEEEIHIRQGQKIFTITFAALNFSQSYRNEYKYMLEGFDEEWNYVGNQHWATYTNLPPGNYVFHVTGSNHDRIWNPELRSIRIIIHPPFYKTVWFIVILVLVVAFLIGYIYTQRVGHMRKLNSMLSELVAARTAELEKQTREIAEKNKKITKQRDLATAQRDHIVKQKKELEEHRHRLEELVEERTQDLVILKDRAIESDRLKTAFLENLSHQIRTPMNAIIGFINLLTENIDDKYSRDYYLRIINESGKNMLNLIHDIIDFSHMQTGQLQPEYGGWTINDILREMITSVRTKVAREKPDLSVIADLPVNDIYMYTDGKKLQQIFSKLLENSIKYTEKGHISLGIHKLEEKWITFFVTDTGIGIKPEHTEKIFDRFFTVAGNDKDAGARESGLGLAFAKVIAELLGGSIWAESIDGMGSSFYFTLPFRQADPKEAGEKKEVGKKFSWPGKKILIAEDEESNYLLIEAILKNTGVELIHCMDGVELLQKIDEGLEYDLVLLDLKMPRMGGINALKLMRESNGQIPVIVQTAYNQTYHREQSRELGCSDFLVKPLRKQELLEVVDKFLK